MSSPLISICLPNLNNRPFLEERMETILAQTFTDWELIVSDNYSEDGAWELFQKYRSDSRIKLSQAPRGGMYANWNACLHRATGQYIYIATSDDTMYPHCLEKLVAALEHHPDVALASCNFDLIDEQGHVFLDEDVPMGKAIYGDWLDKPHRRHGLSEFVATCITRAVWTTITAILFRRSLLDRTGLFPTNRDSTGDYEWALRAMLHTDTVHVPESLATWRIHKHQGTRLFDYAKSGLVGVEMIQAVLAKFPDRLPPAMSTPDARRRLVLPKTIEAFNYLKLYPSAFRDDPLGTVNHLWLGLRRLPPLTLAHLFRGARWRTRPQIDTIHYTQELLAHFQLPPICQPLDG